MSRLSPSTLVLLLLVISTVAEQHNTGTGKCKCFEHLHPYYQNVNCTGFNNPHILPVPNCIQRNRRTNLFVEKSKLLTIGKRFFQNYTEIHVVFVGLRNDSIQNISENVFKPLRYLTGLDVSYNLIDVHQLQKSLTSIQNVRNVQLLNCSHMNIQDLPNNMFQHFRTSEHLNISLQSNQLVQFNYKAFENLTGLKQLKLGRNKILNITFPSDYICHAVILKIDNNELNAFPNFCDNITHFPRLQYLNIQWNFLRHIEPTSFECLSKLQIFHMNGNLIHKLGPNFFAGLKSLKRVTLSESFALQQVKRSAFNNSNLEKVFFRKIFLYTSHGHRNLNFFEGCTSMKLLNMADNILDKTDDDEFDNLFRPLTSLEILIMGGCRLTKIPSGVTKYLLNLKELVLYNNRIAPWPDGFLDSLHRLNIIYMRQNEISSLSERSFRPDFKRDAKTIDFSSNPFHCDCELRWYVDWMKTHQKTFNNVDIVNYKCLTPSKYKYLPLHQVPLSESICLLDLNSKIITLTGSTVLIVLMFVGSVMYRYRWHIRYCVYMMRYKQRPEIDTKRYQYDAFVAYSNEDRPWVIKTLMPVLEESAHLKLCIHDRDFEVGKLIVDNIVDCVESSRCLLIILSNTFARSAWCQFELALIQRHVLENEQRLLVVVMLEEIESRYVTKAMRVMLQTTTYLLWGDEDYARKAFFNRLRLLLGKPTCTGRRVSL